MSPAPCWARATRYSGPRFWAADYAPDGGGESHTYSAAATFDFTYRGDLLLGLIGDQQDGFAGGASSRWSSTSSPTAARFLT